MTGPNGWEGDEMADQVWLEEMRQVLDEVYRDRDRAAVREVYSCASAHVHLTADMLAQLNEVPEGAYTRREMAEAINGVVRGRGRQDTLGLLERPPPIEAVESTAEAARAAWDDTPLEALNPTPAASEPEVPEFREPGRPPPEDEER
ncbi:hypothetical protein [Nonomuraea indica]|uniref:hypothetical protein n=1 Tax=Nonomuraea indica TaxID=1581193 RepID=UPI000C7C72E8|nr:hypothetical protein [Nonomuraea indica]